MGDQLIIEQCYQILRKRINLWVLLSQADALCQAQGK